MLFHSFQYALFLWAVYVAWWTLRERRAWRHSLVLVASYGFYAQADWRFTSLLAVSTIVDHLAGSRIARAREGGGRGRAWLGLSLVSNLGMLGFFKYYDFFVDGFEELLASIGRETSLWHLSADQGGWLEYAVPAGISFYTFQTLSYTIDVYKGRLRPCRSWLDFAVYVSFFPQLVAGPIVRARDFLPQLESPAPLLPERISSGLFQILRGLCKKVVLADTLGVYLVDVAFNEVGLEGIGAPTLLLVTYAYALQLYGDFAGYSDIAIGSARLLGFELPKNFDAPYTSRSLEEFWTRWHISMSSWFQDYVYVGLGGSRVGLLRTMRNVVIAWTLVGLWHGANWTFVIWGAYHGLWLCVVRLARLALPSGGLPDTRLTRVLGVLFTFHVVAFSMILFRCEDLSMFSQACAELLRWDVAPWDLTWPLIALLVLGYAAHFLPERGLARLEAGFGALPAAVQGLVLVASVYGLFVLAPGESPFIYFQF